LVSEDTEENLEDSDDSEGMEDEEGSLEIGIDDVPVEIEI
jgi:hypothetical protein